MYNRPLEMTNTGSNADSNATIDLEHHAREMTIPPSRRQTITMDDHYALAQAQQLEQARRNSMVSSEEQIPSSTGNNRSSKQQGQESQESTKQVKNPKKKRGYVGKIKRRNSKKQSKNDKSKNNKSKNNKSKSKSKKSKRNYRKRK